MSDSFCPICHHSILLDPRYPRAVCAACADRATDGNGRQVRFFNAGLSGGLTGRYADDGSMYETADCLIDGHTCQAKEKHLGGVVIELSVTQ
jgi:hypothetical protein